MTQKEKWMTEAKAVAQAMHRRIQLTIPSVLAVGEHFALRIRVTGPDGLPVTGFEGPLRFTDSIGIEGLPGQIRVNPADGSSHVEGLRAAGPDLALVCATLDLPSSLGRAAVVSSNPAWVFPDPPYRLWFGDLHVHSRYSDCNAWRCLDPEWGYRYARDVAHLDFMALAEHLRGIAAKPERWPRIQSLARDYNASRHFVTFLAYESSHAQGYGGDNNVYFLDDAAPYFWLDRDDLRGNHPAVPLESLWEQVDATGLEYFTVPHHTGRAVKYRSWADPCYNPAREQLFEIYSSWGSSERRHTRMPISGGNNDDASYFVDALCAGARFGVIASSDDHATLPGSVHHFRNEPHSVPMLNGHAHKGLTAVRSGDLTRPALFEALRRRDCYGTTHARSLIDFTLGNISAGREVPADAVPQAKRELAVRLTLQDAIQARVTIVRNGEDIACETLRGRDVSRAVNTVRFTDADPLEHIAIRDARFHPAPFVVYYARVEDNNGAHQWSSPVWLDLDT